jgi:hypothetical protein
MNLFTSFLSSPWRWVVFAGAILLAIAFGAQGVNYASSWLARRHLRTEQSQAETAHAQRLGASTGRYNKYQVDSASRAAERQQLQQDARYLQLTDEALSTHLPARVPLPEQPPRE